MPSGGAEGPVPSGHVENGFIIIFGYVGNCAGNSLTPVADREGAAGGTSPGLHFKLRMECNGPPTTLPQVWTEMELVSALPAANALPRVEGFSCKPCGEEFVREVDE